MPKVLLLTGDDCNKLNTREACSLKELRSFTILLLLRLHYSPATTILNENPGKLPKPLAEIIGDETDIL